MTHLGPPFLRESPSTITIMNCTHLDGHLDEHLDVHLDVLEGLSLRGKKEQVLLSPRKDDLTPFSKEVQGFQGVASLN